MEKSIYTTEYQIFLDVLREVRRKAKITQVELADKVGTTQSIVSKWERGEVRLDLAQLRMICHALGTSLPAFINRYEKRLKERGR